MSGTGEPLPPKKNKRGLLALKRGIDSLKQDRLLFWRVHLLEWFWETELEPEAIFGAAEKNDTQLSAPNTLRLLGYVLSRFYLVS